MKINVSDAHLEIERNGKVEAIDWMEVRRIYFPIFGNFPIVRTQTQGSFQLRKEETDLTKLMPKIFTVWMEKNPHLAQKAAFDYGEPPKQGAWLLICLATLFCFILCGMLWLEASTQYACSEALRSSPVLEKNPEIVKLKKKKRGNFQVTLKFTAGNGRSYEGQRLTMETYKMGNDPDRFSVVYAEAKPHCWMLSENPDEIDVNWARRRYLTAFDFFVGLCFFVTGVMALYVGIRRLREVRPGRQAVLDLMHVNLTA